MVLQSSATLENTIRTIFPEIWLRQLSIETCFIKRERKIKSEVMFWVLTLGFCVYNQHTIEGLAKEPGRKLSKKLKNFQDILIQDSTIVRLHSSLADKFPATRSRTIAAGVKVSIMVSAIANGPKTIALYSEKTAEIKTLRIGPWIKDRILLVDLG